MKFEKLGERPLYTDDRLTIVMGSFKSPDGEEFEREFVRRPGAVCVVPIIDGDEAGDAEVVMVRQYRSSLHDEILEIPAGRRDVPGEPVEDTAKRELLEEVGYIAGELTQLARCLSSPGFCDEEAFVFLARDLKKVEAQPEGIEENNMTVEHVRLADAPKLVRDGNIVDSQSIIGLLLARELLGIR